MIGRNRFLLEKSIIDFWKIDFLALFGFRFYFFRISAWIVFEGNVV